MVQPHLTRIIATAGLLGLAFFFGCQAQSPPDPSETISGQTMGTVYRVRAVYRSSAENVGQLAALQPQIDAVLRQVNKQMSTYDPESELSRLNQAAPGTWIEVSPALVEVLEKARTISRQSDGAFDVTVGPAVNLWRFGPDKKRKAFPTDDEIGAAVKLVDYRQVEWETDPPRVRKMAEGAYVDLSAIAKGYGVDQVFELLTEQGFEHYMVEIGGEVRTAGRNTSGKPWQIAVEHPDDDGVMIGMVVGLKDMSLATSGDYRNFFIHEGRRYSHTIDPKTGRPVEHDLASVSVLHKECALADGYATALLVLGPVEGYNLAIQHGIAAYFQQRADEGAVSSRATPAWEAYQSQSQSR